MPNRIIKESIKTSDEIDSLSWFEEVMFYRILVTVDDYGCMDGRITVVRNQLFPTKDNVTSKSIETALSTLETNGLIKKYFFQGHPYIQVAKWEKHQRVRGAIRKFPDPSECDAEQIAADCGELRQVAANCGEMPPKSNPNPNPNPIQSESNTNARTPFDASLEEFRKYRRQLGKKLTPLAETKLLNELERLAPGDDQTKIAILDQSICNGWTGVFPLKGKKDHGYQEHPSGNLDALLVDLDAEGGEPDATSKWTAV